MNEKASSNTSRTNWARINAMSDDEIDTSDVAPLGKEFFARAKLRPPTTVVHAEIPIDADLLIWFKSLGPEWERRVNAALRIYAEAHWEPDHQAVAETVPPTAPGAARRRPKVPAVYVQCQTPDKQTSATITVYFAEPRDVVAALEARFPVPEMNPESLPVATTRKPKLPAVYVAVQTSDKKSSACTTLYGRDLTPEGVVDALQALFEQTNREPSKGRRHTAKESA